MTEGKDTTIARLTAERDAARAEGFAQGIEAAAKAIRSRCPIWPPDGPPDMASQIVNDTLCDAFYAVDELSPTPQADQPGYVSPIYGILVELSTQADPVKEAAMSLAALAANEASKAICKFPQPNYVISKVAEEAGEVVKAAIHCAEGRETPENLKGEIVQTIAMLVRLYVEGDQVHGLRALAQKGE